MELLELWGGALRCIAELKLATTFRLTQTLNVSILKLPAILVGFSETQGEHTPLGALKQKNISESSERGRLMLRSDSILFHSNIMIAFKGTAFEGYFKKSYSERRKSIYERLRST